MHILFTRFPLESAHGGAEKQTISLMCGLKARGHEVSFLGSCPVLLDESPKFKILSTKMDIGAPPVTKWGAVSSLWRRFGMQKKLAQFWEEGRGLREVDAVVMLSLSEKLLLTPLLIKQGIQVIWLEHDPIGRWLTKNPWLSRLRKLSKHVTTVCVSELSRQLYIDLGWPEENMTAIPNGITVERSPRQRPEDRGQRTEVLRLGCVARLAREKGIDVLLHALNGLKDIELTIVGKGPEEQRLKDHAHGLHVRFESYVEDLNEFYRSLDALILPSRSHDPFGLVAAEAMAAGTPVIVTDACGIAGSLEGDEGIVVPANSPGALREAIEELKDPQMREKMSAAGRKAAEEKFSVERMVDAYERLFLEQ